MAALSRMEISLAYPVAVGLTFVVVILFGLLFFGESVNTYKIIRIALVFPSIFFLAQGD
jgi:multidrug transporter EmrE-like cation transporter